MTNPTPKIAESAPTDAIALTTPASPVLLDVTEGIAFVTLNRPESLNAMNAELMSHLRQLLAELAHDQAIRCVVLRGAGRAFCSGGDVRDIASRRQAAAEGASLGATLEEQSRSMLYHEDSIRLLHTMPKPTLAVVHGHAIGGGLSFALACDLRIVARNAKLRVGFRKRSLSGDFGIAYFLTHTVGAAKARELLLLDPMVDGSRAFELGLATAVAEDHELEAKALELAIELASGPTIAMGRMKDNVFAAETLSLDDALRLEAMNIRVSANTLDAAEAGSAFAERREPNFTGQ